MAELGHNHNIQIRRLFQELKATYPCIPDAAVRQCMKQHRNDRVKCMEQLQADAENYALGRYGLRNKALLSHQMDQLLKLNRELSEGKKEVDGIKNNIKDLEQELKAQELMMQSHAPKLVHGEVKMLEGDITDLRGACDNMSKRVTNLTSGKVPLGETSINFENYLSSSGTARVPDTSSLLNISTPVPTNQLMSEWSCSECTFQNHPSLESCEICEMPRITLGTNQSPCFCHNPTFHHLNCLHRKYPLQETPPPRIFSQPKYDQEMEENTNNTTSERN